MGKFIDKLKVAFWVFIDILSGFVIGLVLGAGIICLIPLMLIIGILFVIWILGELCVWSIVDKSDNDKDESKNGIEYADEDD